MVKVKFQNKKTNWGPIHDGKTLVKKEPTSEKFFLDPWLGHYLLPLGSTTHKQRIFHIATLKKIISNQNLAM